MQSDKQKPKYIASSRARTAGTRNFSGQNFFAQAVSSTPSVPVDESAQKRKRLLTIIGISAGSILVVLAIIVLAIRRYSNAGAGDISVEEFNARIEYHDVMNCTVYEGSKVKSSDFVVLAKDGWDEAYIGNIWLADNVTDIIYVNDLIYSVVYDGVKNDKNVVKEKSFIETEEQFTKRTGLEFPEGLMLDLSDNRNIHCKAQGDELEYYLPNVSRFTNIGGGGF